MSVSGRPRVSRAGDPWPGLFLGAIVGGVLTRKSEGAAVGAALGAVATGSSTEVPLPLEQAVQLLLRQKAIEFISLVRRGPLGANLSIHVDGRYRILRASADGARNETERDDMLYDQFVHFIDELPRANELR